LRAPNQGSAALWSDIIVAQLEELATGDFIRRGTNLLMVGRSGIGKCFNCTTRTGSP